MARLTIKFSIFSILYPTPSSQVMVNFAVTLRPVHPSTALLTCQDFTYQCILSDSMVYINPSEASSSSLLIVIQPLSQWWTKLVAKCQIDTLEVSLACCNQGEFQCHSSYFKSDGGRYVGTLSCRT